MELENLKVMLVEDNAYIRVLTKTILRALGIKAVMECTDGEAGLRALVDFDANIILADWLMRPMDGIEFLRSVRNGKAGTNPYVPIIMVTGQTFIENVTIARDAGANGFVAKPISVRLLYERIEDVLERPRPFLQTEDYFGPDRRRRDLSTKDDQRQKDVLAVALPETSIVD